MTTTEVPVTIERDYFSLPRHIRKGMLKDELLRQICVQQLVASNFAKNQKKILSSLPAFP